MDKTYFLEMLRKYNQGTASKEEYQFILTYYNLFENDPEIAALWSKQKREEVKEQIHSALLENIITRESKARHVRSFDVRMVLRVAATVLLLVSVSWVLLWLNRSSEVERTAVEHSRTNSGNEHRVIRLSDGSTIIVYAGSKLDYPSSFNGLEAREVYLKGQAYFDIKHNPDKPFIVHTGDLYTTVLGTAFNIKAFPGDVDIIVTVSRGKVKVSDHNKTLGIILPDEQIIFNKTENSVVKEKVNSVSYLAWKEEDLLFDDVTVAEAVELLEERFDVTISFSHETTKTKRFTTTFLKGESLERVLKSICEFNDATFVYHKENATVLIMDKNK